MTALKVNRTADLKSQLMSKDNYTDGVKDMATTEFYLLKYRTETF